jgi:hypothetical protein
MLLAGVPTDSGARAADRAIQDLCRLPWSARLSDHTEAVGDRPGTPQLSVNSIATQVTVPRTLMTSGSGPATSPGWQHLTADRAKAAFD